MNDFIVQSAFFGIFISLAAYEIGMLLKKKLRSALFNPLLIAIIIVIAVLLIFRIDYNTYKAGAQYLNYLLTPATVCLAVPLYERFSYLKKYPVAVLAGIMSGILTSAACIIAFCLVFKMGHTEYVTLLPKSITTAIAMGVSEELGGNVNITVAAIIITGIGGNVMAPFILKLFRIKEPVAQGVALGSAAHAIGTARAIEMGEIQGAMSSLSLAVSGFLTVFTSAILSGII